MDQFLGTMVTQHGGARVVDRLSALDASFLYLEERTCAVHVGSVGIFAPPREGFDHDRLVGLIAELVARVQSRRLDRTRPSRAVRAEALLTLAGFAPPTLHFLGARLAGSLGWRLFPLMVANVPGPQVPLYADGARMLAAYPVTPLVPGHGLAVASTSYAGAVYFGLTADRDLLPDLDVLGQCPQDALADLVGTVR